MEIITYIASRVWCFFSLLGQVGMMPLRYATMESMFVTADNPFNDFVLHVDVAVGDNIAGDIIGLITRITNTADYTVFEGLLFSFALLFIVSIFARLISFTTPD